MSLFFDTKQQDIYIGRIAALVVFVGVLVVAVLAAGCPVYSVWSERLHGEAELARATANRRIVIQEAESKKEAAKLLGEAEVARAHGLAEANQIVGKSLGGPENYLRYLWIQNIDKVTGQVIYVPSENGLPLTEAGRLSVPKEK
jgi:hypothetical protein